MTAKSLSEQKLRHRVRVWREHNQNATHAAKELGICPSGMRHSIRMARKRGLLVGGGEEETTPAAHTIEPQSRSCSLAEVVLGARPRTWWDDLTAGQQFDLLQLKADHLAGKHRIKAQQIYELCAGSIGVLLQNTTSHKFRVWLTDAKEELPK